MKVYKELLVMQTLHSLDTYKIVQATCVKEVWHHLHFDLLFHRLQSHDASKDQFSVFNHESIA